MSTDNKEFFDLLNSISNEQVFTLQLAPRDEPKALNCKYLTTIQLKELIKAAVDSPITQSVFNSTVNKIFKQSLSEPTKEQLTVVDRLLFIIETRINSLSSKMKYKTRENDKDVEIDIDFESVKLALYNALESNRDLFKPQTAVDGKVSITFGAPLLEAEQQLNEELYKNADPNVNNTEELRTVLGEAFINEIAKCLQTIVIGDKTLDLSKVTFKNRLKTIESLPASTIQAVIGYIEKYKRVIDECLRIDGVAIPIDSTIFSIR